MFAYETLLSFQVDKLKCVSLILEIVRRIIYKKFKRIIDRGGQCQMEVIRATMAHIEDVTILFDKYRQFYGEKSDLKSAKAFLQLRLSLNESVLFLAVQDGNVIGFAQLYPTFSSIAMQRAFILNDLYVIEDARGTGAGNALIETVFQYCQEQHARYVTLQTAPDNVIARGLYERVGMEQDEYCNYVKYFK